MESGHRDCLLQQSQDLTSGFAAGSAPALSRELQLSYFWFRLQTRAQLFGYSRLEVDLQVQRKNVNKPISAAEKQKQNLNQALKFGCRKILQSRGVCRCTGSNVSD